VRIDALLDAPPSVQTGHVLGDEVVNVRPARPEDVGMIDAYIRALSFASRYTRFLGQVNAPTPTDLYRMTHGVDATPPALIVESGDGDARTVIGEARYALDGIACEFALSVSEAWRDKGLGTLLMGIIGPRQATGSTLPRRRCLALEPTDAGARAQAWICCYQARIGRQAVQDYKASFSLGMLNGFASSIGSSRYRLAHDLG
jgi:hypothetical protein